MTITSIHWMQYKIYFEKNDSLGFYSNSEVKTSELLLQNPKSLVAVEGSYQSFVDG